MMHNFSPLCIHIPTSPTEIKFFLLVVEWNIEFQVDMREYFENYLVNKTICALYVILHGFVQTARILPYCLAGLPSFIIPHCNYNICETSSNSNQRNHHHLVNRFNWLVSYSQRWRDWKYKLRGQNFHHSTLSWQSL